MIPAGHKYALLALPKLRAGSLPSSALELAEGLAVCTALPLELPRHWSRWLGELRIRDLKEVSLFLVATGASRSPDVLDDENKALTDRVRSLYFGLLVAVPNVGHALAPTLTGSHHLLQREPPIDVRRVQDYPQVWFVRHAPRPDVNLGHLQRAAVLSEGLQRLQGIVGPSNRLWRMLLAFYVGLQSDDLGTRVHEFVRCVEGLILPRRGCTKEDFAERSSLIVGNNFAACLADIYDIRSGVEHLHGPLRYLPNNAPRQRRLTLLRRAIEIEWIARAVLDRILSRPELSPHLQDDQCLEQFWMLASQARQDLWGDVLDPTAATAQVIDDWIPDRDLGL